MRVNPPSISVVVPTHRKPGPLAWTLTSILGQKLDPGVARRARVVVVNNDDQQTAPVERAVERAVSIAGHGPWEVRVVHRKPPMYPVYSWYEGIREFTDENDLVFLNGDDDIMLPGGIAARIRMIEQGSWDMLITAALTGLFFTGTPDDEEVAALLPPDLGGWQTPVWREPQPLTGPGLNDVCAIFISNHLYRNTPLFWEAYRETLALMSSVPAGGDDRFAMLPQFLPLPLIESGRIGASAMPACIRGQAAHDVVGSSSGRINWVRPGYYYASCLYLLDNALHHRTDLETLRRAYRELTQRWHAASRRMDDYRATIKGLGVLGLRAGPRGWARILRGWGDVLAHRLNVNAFTLRRRLARQRPVARADFFHRD